MKGKTLVVCDVDGVLFDHRGRDHLIPPADKQGNNVHWQTHQRAAVNDPPLIGNIEIVRRLTWAPDTVLSFATSRARADCGRDTAHLLMRAGLLSERTVDLLVMREPDEHVPPARLKQVQLQRLYDHVSDRYGVVHDIIVIEDSQANIDAMAQVRAIPVPVNFILLKPEW